jgi:hypothetical protein
MQVQGSGLDVDAGSWMLDTGYWILDAGCWILDAGYSNKLNRWREITSSIFPTSTFSLNPELGFEL